MSIWDTWAKDPRYSQVIGDPRFTQSTPLYKSKIHDILFNYGFTGTPDQIEAAGGPVEQNPYSVANLLKQNYANANHSSINDLNSAGLQESGAAVGALNANTEGYKRGVSEAVSRMGGEMTSATGDYTNTVNSIFGDAEQNPVPVQPMPQSVGPAPGQATGAGTPFPTPQQPYQRTGPEAGWNSVASKVKKIKPGFGGRAL